VLDDRGARGGRLDGQRVACARDAIDAQAWRGALGAIGI
jgi:hypothetical protein